MHLRFSYETRWGLGAGADEEGDEIVLSDVFGFDGVPEGEGGGGGGDFVEGVGVGPKGGVVVVGDVASLLQSTERLSNLPQVVNCRRVDAVEWRLCGRPDPFRCLRHEVMIEHSSESSSRTVEAPMNDSFMDQKVKEGIVGR